MKFILLTFLIFSTSGIAKLTERRLTPPAKNGAKLFVEYGCNACHGRNLITGPQLVNLHGSYVKLMSGKIIKVDDAYLKESIWYPEKEIVRGFANQMPSYKDELSDKQVSDLISYIKELNYSNMSAEGYGVTP